MFSLIFISKTPDCMEVGVPAIASRDRFLLHIFFWWHGFHEFHDFFDDISWESCKNWSFSGIVDFYHFVKFGKNQKIRDLLMWAALLCGIPCTRVVVSWYLSTVLCGIPCTNNNMSCIMWDTLHSSRLVGYPALSENVLFSLTIPILLRPIHLAIRCH